MTTCACGCGTEMPEPRYPSWRRRYIHNHHRSKAPVQYVVDENGCWLWQRSVSTDGYPTMGVGNRKTAKAHRVFYVRAHGEVPEGLELHHICGVRHCVNPDHLEPIARLEHRRRHPRGNEVSWAT